MTTITVERALLEQALAALECAYSENYDGAKIHGAKVAIRAALSAPATAPAIQYPPLPIVAALLHSDGYWTSVAGGPLRPKPDNFSNKEVFTADQMRAYVDADRAQRAPSSADDLRALGWTVAVHNDYRLNGVAHTFWLLTKDGRCIKGEGLSDADALKEIRTMLSAAPQAQPATAPEPSWQDAPTVPGLWVSDFSWMAQKLGRETVEFYAKNRSIPSRRWYGPIPEDKQ